MLTSFSKKPTPLLTLLLLAFTSLLVINGQQAKQTALTNADDKQANILANAQAVSIRPVNKASQPHFSGHVSSWQAVAERGLSPQDWLADFKAAYPTDDNAVKKLMAGISAEQRPGFIEQLLRQVQFLQEGDAVRAALENVLMMRLTELDPPRAADYVILALVQQKQAAQANPAAFPDYRGALIPPMNGLSQPYLMGHQLIGGLMQAWGKKDLPQAVEWALALEDEQLKHEALNLLSYTRDQHKIDLIADEVNRLPEGNVRSGLLTQLAEQKAQIDPDAAVNWVSSWPDSTERNKAISAIIGNRTSQSLEATASLVEQALAAGINPDETATDMLINQWHYKAPEEAYQWASNLPDSAVKNRALLLLDAFKAEAEAK